MKIYRTKQQEMLDQIALEQYDTTVGTVEAILEANPGLAEHGPILPQGLEISLPEIPQPPDDQEVRLWD